MLSRGDVAINLVNHLQKNHFDLVFGTRLHQNSNISIVRKCGNLVYVLLLKFFLHSQLSDVCSGMRVFRSELSSQITSLCENDLSFSIHLTSYAILQKWKLGEKPIFYRERVGKSKLSLIFDGSKFLKVLLMISFSRK